MAWGAVATGNALVADHVKRLRQYGWTRRDFSESEGRNSRLDEVQAAISAATAGEVTLPATPRRTW